MVLKCKTGANALANDEELKSNVALHHIMSTCFQFFACYTMEKEAADFLASGFINSTQHELLRNQVDELLIALRPQAVALVDSFALPEYVLPTFLPIVSSLLIDVKQLRTK